MLVGDKITLRPLKVDDVYKINEWRNNIDNIIATIGIRFPKSFDLDMEWIKNVILDKSNKNIYFGIVENVSSELIGIIQLNNIDWIYRTTEFGIVIGDKNMRGKGYSKEAMSLIISYASDIINLRKINLRVLSSNTNAINLYKKFGFILCGELKKEVFVKGDYKDISLYSKILN